MRAYIVVKPLLDRDERVTFCHAGDGSYVVMHTVAGKPSSAPAPTTLRSVGLAGVVDVFHDQTHVSVVSQPGVELLTERLQSLKRLAESDARAVFLALATALRSVHAAGLVHGCVSPDHVLMTSSSSHAHATLADHALSVLLDGPSYVAVLRRRLQYLAPETLVALRAAPHELRCEPPVDLWGLGVTLFVALVGVYPFTTVDFGGDVFQNVAHARYSFDHPRWKSVSVEAKTLVASLLQAEPQKRLTLDAVLAHPWLSGVSLPAAPTTGLVPLAQVAREPVVVLEPLSRSSSLAAPSPAKKARHRAQDDDDDDDDDVVAVVVERATSSNKRARESPVAAAAPEPKKTAPAEAAAASVSKRVATTYTKSALAKQRVAELRALATQLGIESAGTKDQIVARILDAQSK